MYPANYQSLKMCFWNIGGLKTKGLNKYNDNTFLNELKKIDIVFLAETHLGHDFSINSIGPFHCHFICRKASKHNKRSFGG